MRRLLIATAVIEVGAGVALVSWPSAMATLLVGAPLDAHTAVSLVRVGGAGLFALGSACWLERSDAWSAAARGLVAAMFLYHAATVVILGSAGIRWQPVGVLLWPTVMVHFAMAVWCVAELLRKPALSTDPGGG